VAPYRVIHGADGRVWRTGAGRLATTCTPLDCCEPPPPPPPPGGEWIEATLCECSESSTPRAYMDVEDVIAAGGIGVCPTGELGDGSCWEVLVGAPRTTTKPPDDQILFDVKDRSCCECCPSCQKGTLLLNRAGGCPDPFWERDIEREVCCEIDSNAVEFEGMGVVTFFGVFCPVSSIYEWSLMWRGGVRRIDWTLKQFAPRDDCPMDLTQGERSRDRNTECDTPYSASWQDARTARSIPEADPSVWAGFLGSPSECLIPPDCQNSVILNWNETPGLSAFSALERSPARDCEVRIEASGIITRRVVGEIGSACDSQCVGSSLQRPIGSFRRTRRVGGVLVPSYQTDRLRKVIQIANATGRGCAGCGEDGGL